MIEIQDKNVKEQKNKVINQNDDHKNKLQNQNEGKERNSNKIKTKNEKLKMEEEEDFEEDIIEEEDCKDEFNLNNNAKNQPNNIFERIEAEQYWKFVSSFTLFGYIFLKLKIYQTISWTLFNYLFLFLWILSLLSISIIYFYLARKYIVGKKIIHQVPIKMWPIVEPFYGCVFVLIIFLSLIFGILTIWPQYSALSIIIIGSTYYLFLNTFTLLMTKLSVFSAEHAID